MNQVQQVVDAVLRNSKARSAVLYVSAQKVMRVTRRFRHRKGCLRTEVVLTVGVPNAREREFIQRCRKSHSLLPAYPVVKLYKETKRG